MTEMTWQAAAVLTSVVIGLIGINAGIFRWLFSRFIDQIDKRIESLGKALQGQSERTTELEKDLLRLKADLPRDYVRRGDWIRFSTVIDSKLDSINNRIEKLMEEMRDARDRS